MQIRRIMALILSLILVCSIGLPDYVYASEDIPMGVKGAELLQELRAMGLGRGESNKPEVTTPGVIQVDVQALYDMQWELVERTTLESIQIVPLPYDEEKLDRYIQSLSAYQVISVEDTDITQVENDELYNRLTDEQLEEIVQLKTPISSLTTPGPLMPPVLLEDIEDDLPEVMAIDIDRQSTFKTPPDGLKLNKKAVWDEATGTATITLEAYTTGTVSTNVTGIPADIILVLDQSGSMAETYGAGEQILNVSQLDKSQTYTWNGYQVKYRYGIWRYKVNNRWELLPSNAQITITLNVVKKDSLVTAATRFVQSVKENAEELGIDHRIAVVGFASESGYGDNTGVFVGSSFYTYNTLSNMQYSKAFQDVSTATGVSAIEASIQRLQTQGATRSDLGMEMAKKIFANDNYQGSHKKRNRVVVMFTDGTPTTDNTFSQSVANGAIAHSNVIKKKTTEGGYGATVYTIGIMSGANPGTIVDNVNRYMNCVSSNYPNAISMTNYGNRVSIDKNYYLAAGSSEELDEIFVSISEEVERPTISLDSTTEIRDWISDYFEIASSVSVYTRDFVGGTVEQPSWGKVQAVGVETQVNGKEISVTGYDYDANFLNIVNGTRKGRELVIEFKIKPIAGFVGGNGVSTNTDASGIYSDKGGVIGNFVTPKVNVGLKYDFEGHNQSIYITNTVEAPLDFVLSSDTNGRYVEYLVDGKTYRLGNKYNDFVRIMYTVCDAMGGVVGTYTVAPGATLGTWYNQAGYIAPRWIVENKYHITCSIVPSNVSEQSVGNLQIEKSATVYIFTPKVMCKDTSMYLGTKLDTGQLNTQVTIDGWEYRGGISGIPKVSGVAPTLAYEYRQAKNMEVVGDWWLELDTDLNILVKSNEIDITNQTMITKAGGIQDTHHLTVSVKSCTLEIEKVADQGTAIGSGEQFIFQVVRVKNNSNEPDKFQQKYGKVQVVISGTGQVIITGLPIGNYTIVEDEQWSWRYTSQGKGQVTLSERVEQQKAHVKMINQKKNDKWLSFEKLVRNVYVVIRS